jgi:hypothetical protein
VTRLLAQAIIFAIAYTALSTVARAIAGGEHLALVAWWVFPAFAFGFWTAKALSKTGKA